jgi:acetolactate synthase small subunit
MLCSICSEIVDRAQKELNIEKQIKKIEDTWAVLALHFTPLADSDVMSLQVRLLGCSWCNCAAVCLG